VLWSKLILTSTLAKSFGSIRVPSVFSTAQAHWKLSVKVGDLVVDVRSSHWWGLVLKVDPYRRAILIVDKEGSVFWEKWAEYGVISESR